MVEFQVDPADLRTVANQVSEVVGWATTGFDELSSDAGVVGCDSVAGAIGGFRDRWEAGMGILTADLGAASTMLRDAANTYEASDAGVADAAVTGED